MTCCPSVSGATSLAGLRRADDVCRPRRVHRGRRLVRRHLGLLLPVRPGQHGGESETLIGGWLRARGASARNRLTIATKVGKWKSRLGLARSNVRAALGDSRRRLGVDVVDLYYAHEDDPAQRIEDIVATFDELVREGSVRNYGLSNFGLDRFTAALKVAKSEGYALPAALQPDYSLVHRGEVEATGLGAAAVEHGVAIVPTTRSPQGSSPGSTAGGKR